MIFDNGKKSKKKKKRDSWSVLRRQVSEVEERETRVARARLGIVAAWWEECPSDKSEASLSCLHVHASFLLDEP